MTAREIFIVAFYIICLIGPADSGYGGFFSIQLKNGNIFETEKYWQEDQAIFFFTQNGMVGLPSSIIDHISTTSSNLNTDTIYYPYVDTNKEESNAEVLSGLPQESKNEIISDLIDRIAVVQTNIESLTKNLETYTMQKEKYTNDKEKAETRLLRLKTDSYLTSNDLQERTSLEENRLADTDQKIEQLKSQIQNTQNMVESQKRIKMRLENELAKHDS